MIQIKLDIKTRIKNPTFWVHLIISIVLMCLTYFNLQPEDITSFPILFDVIKRTISNPYMIGQILWVIWSTIYNPTTKGFGD